MGSSYQESYHGAESALEPSMDGAPELFRLQ